jgi:hypothetical protein
VRKLYFQIALFVSLTSAGWAQSMSLALFQHATDNLFQTRYGEKDSISNVAFSLDQPFRPFSFFTEGGYSYLAENNIISFYTQEAGLDYLYAAGAKTALYASVKAGGAIYKEDYQDFNYFSLGFMGAAKSYLTPSSILKFTYTGNYKGYPVDRFDYHSHLASLAVDKYFPSRTTLKAEGTYGYKYFLHPFADEGMTAEPAVTDGAGSGRGRMAGPGPAGQSGDPIAPAATGQGSGVQIAGVSGLVAQGLGDRVGLRLTGFRQWTLSGESPFNSIAEFYMVENPTYDVFSWNGFGWAGQATIEAPWNTQLKLGYTWSDKRFPGIEAMDLTGTSLGLLRRDVRSQWDIRLEKNFPAFTLYAFYSYVRNVSNDPLFDWTGNYLGVSVEWRMNWGKGR